MKETGDRAILPIDPRVFALTESDTSAKVTLRYLVDWSKRVVLGLESLDVIPTKAELGYVSERFAAILKVFAEPQGVAWQLVGSFVHQLASAELEVASDKERAATAQLAGDML